MNMKWLFFPQNSPKIAGLNRDAQGYGQGPKDSIHNKDKTQNTQTKE